METTVRINQRVAKLISLREEEKSEVFNSVQFYKDSMDILLQAKECWEGLNTARENRQRNRRYTFGDNNGQWSDIMEGTVNKTEAQHISDQGKTPLQFNIILSTIQTILGQFRANQMEPVCSARDRQEQSLGEMMSVALQYVYQLNTLWELDGNNLLEAVISGVCASKCTYGWIPALQRCDTRVENRPLPRMFFDPMNDIRGWDMKIVGEIHDMTKADIVAMFSNGSKARAEELIKIFRACNSEYLGNYWDNLSTRRSDWLNFFTPDTTNKCRVIEAWKLESREKYWCHDTLEGKSYWLPYTREIEGQIRFVNNQRTAEAERFQIAPKLIQYKWGTHQFWYYRFFAPTGEILKEGESPYLHGSHPYTITPFLVMDGKPHAFVESAIDAQRMLNRNLTLLDFIIGASAKGTLMIAKGTIPSDSSQEEWMVQYRKVGGVILWEPNPNLPDGGAPKEIASQARLAGASDMIGMIMNLFPDMTGVHGALQGQEAQSGTSGKLYEAQAVQSATNLVDTFETYKTHRTNRDKKMMQVTQQYYTSGRYINIAGKQYSDKAKWYDPEKVMDADLDLSLTESVGSVKDATNNLLMTLFDKQAISAKTLLSQLQVPGSENILQAIESEEQEMAEMQAQNPQPPQLPVTPGMIPA